MAREYAGRIGPRVLILTPVKDAMRYVDQHLSNVASLEIPRDRLSLGLLESDSVDGTYEHLASRLEELRERYRRVTLLKRDFGYRLPPGRPRSAQELQLERRSVLAKSRNHLLIGALDDEDWVLWIDHDVVRYPPDVVARLLASGKDIVTPNCLLDGTERSFDLNAWTDGGNTHLDDLRGSELVRLEAVGGTMLLVRADLHRDGLVFPPFLYGAESPLARYPSPITGYGVGEIETEGLALMAHDMGHRCWGMPDLAVYHADA